MSLVAGTRLGLYEIHSATGAGGPVSVRGVSSVRELRRGLAAAKQKTRPCSTHVSPPWCGRFVLSVLGGDQAGEIALAQRGELNQLPTRVAFRPRTAGW